MKSDLQKTVEAIRALDENLNNLKKFTLDKIELIEKTIKAFSKVIEFNKEYALVSYAMVSQSLAIIVNYDKELKEAFIRTTGELLSDEKHSPEMVKTLQLMNDIATCDTPKPPWIPEIIGGDKKEEID